MTAIPRSRGAGPRAGGRGHSGGTPAVRDAATRRRAVARAPPLDPGDLVVVRTPEQIGETLDAKGECDGVAFTPAMEAFAGEAFWVAGDEGMSRGPWNAMVRGLQRRAVSLEGTYCGPGRHADRHPASGHLWHEAWLERLASGGDTREESASALGLAFERVHRTIASTLPRASPGEKPVRARAEQPGAIASGLRWLLLLQRRLPDE